MKNHLDRYRLIELAQQYHKITEEFDRNVCTGPYHRGCIMPSTDFERHLIVKHAREVKKELTKQANDLGFSEGEFQKAIFNDVE